MPHQGLGSFVGGIGKGLGRVANSVGRQFDKTPGGGFADEAESVLAPGRAASPTTEAGIRQFGETVAAGVVFGPMAFTSQRGETLARTTTTPSVRSIGRQFDDVPGGGFADVTLQTVREKADVPELDRLFNLIPLVVGLLVFGAFLFLLRPIFEIIANLTD